MSFFAHSIEVLTRSFTRLFAEEGYHLARKYHRERELYIIPIRNIHVYNARAVRDFSDPENLAVYISYTIWNS